MPYTKPRLPKTIFADISLIIGLGADANHWTYRANNRTYRIYLGSDEGRLKFYNLYKQDKLFRLLVAENEEARQSALPVLLQMSALHGTDKEIAQIAKRLKELPREKITINYLNPIPAILSLIDLQAKQKSLDLRLNSAEKLIQKRFHYHAKDLKEISDLTERKKIEYLRNNNILHSLRNLFFEKSNIPSFITKEDICNYIISLPSSKDSDVILFINAALDQSTQIGKFMSISSSSSESRKALKVLSDHLKFIEERNKKLILNNFFSNFRSLSNRNQDTNNLKVPNVATKEDICNYILSLPGEKKEEAKKLIEATLDSSTPLGKFMKIKRGLFAASESRGTLKILSKHLAQIQYEETSTDSPLGHKRNPRQ